MVLDGLGTRTSWMFACVCVEHLIDKSNRYFVDGDKMLGLLYSIGMDSAL